MTIESREITFLGSEQNRLFGRIFSPSGDRSDSNSHSHSPSPILFMHGGGQTHHSWDKSAERVASLGFSCISLDARGHGESEWVSCRRYTFLDYRDDLICDAREICSQFGGSPILVGASLGGLCGMLAVERDSDLFCGLVFVDITPTMNLDGVAKIQGFMVERMADGFGSIEEASDAIALYLPHRKRSGKGLGGLRKNLRLGDDGRYYWHWDPSFWSGPYPISTDPLECDRLTRLGCSKMTDIPVLLVRGERSELVSESAAREFLELVPHAHYTDVSRAGHMVAGDSNDIFVSSILDFINQTVH